MNVSDLSPTLIKVARSRSKWGWVAVFVPTTMERALKRLQREIDPDDLADDGVEKEPHVTIAYGLDNNVDTSRLKLTFALSTPVTFRVEDVSTFTDNPKYDVLKYRVKSGELTYLRRRVREDFGIPGTTYRYNPHVTIAYVKKGKAEKYLKKFKQLVGRSYTTTQAVYDPKGFGKRYRIRIGRGQFAYMHKEAEGPAQGKALKHIYLTGYPGAGKTTEGERLSKELGMDLISLDGVPGMDYTTDTTKTALEVIEGLENPSVVEGVQLMDFDPEYFDDEDLRILDAAKEILIQRTLARGIQDEPGGEILKGEHQRERHERFFKQFDEALAKIKARHPDKVINHVFSEKTAEHDDDAAPEGKCWRVLWADGRAQQCFKRKSHAQEFWDSGHGHSWFEGVQNGPKLVDRKKGWRVRNTSTTFKCSGKNWGDEQCPRCKKEGRSFKKKTMKKQASSLKEACELAVNVNLAKHWMHGFRDKCEEHGLDPIVVADLNNGRNEVN